jgi:hypothetical protein
MMCNHKFFHKYLNSFINEMTTLVIYKMGRVAKASNNLFISKILNTLVVLSWIFFASII